MDELISRQAAIDAHCELCGDRGRCNCDICPDVEVFQLLPSAQPDLDEWCTDCKEYDQERHCCPRFNRVIRKTAEEVRQNAQPEPGWIPCSEETGDGYPEEDGFYYVTEQNYGFYLDADYKQRVTHTSHFKNGDFTDRFYTENNSNITAWMPLPTAYERSEE